MRLTALPLFIAALSGFAFGIRGLEAFAVFSIIVFLTVLFVSAVGDTR
jgi:hypothetical protein